jgi:hypothetical protein
VIIGLAGTIAATQILQEVYERIFGLERRGWRDLWRFVVWVLVLLAVLAGEGRSAEADPDQPTAAVLASGTPVIAARSWR